MKHLHRRALGNAGAAVAGVVIGGLVVVLFFFLCIWPIIRRYYQQYRARRNGHHQGFDPESGEPNHLASDALTGSHFDRPRRLPSSDSLKLPDDNDDGHHHHSHLPHQQRHHHHPHHAVIRDPLSLDDPSSSSPSKNLSWSSSHDDARALADGEGQLHLHHYHYPTYPASAMVTPGQSSPPHDDEHHPVPSPANNGDLSIETPPHVHQTYVLKHTNEDYYDPSIPSEAFGMVTTPPGPNAAVVNRPRSTSITQQVKQMFHRKSVRERTTSTGTASSAGQTQSYSGNTIVSQPHGVPPMQQITDEELMHSPIEHSPTHMSLPSPTAVQPNTNTPGALAHSPSITSPTEQRLKTSPSPPAHPAPGTVNPMDIMPASTESELWHRTEHQLYISSYESPPQLPSFMEQANMEHITGTTSQSPGQDTFEQHVSDGQAMGRNTADTMSDEELAEKDDIVMIDMPVHTSLNHSSNHLNTSLQVGSSRRPSNPSEHSTPFPGPASTDASSHNTPSTLLDSPSPESIHSSDFRHSASPQLAQSVPLEKVSVFRCDELGCNQVFDQPHKLK